MKLKWTSNEIVSKNLCFPDPQVHLTRIMSYLLCILCVTSILTIHQISAETKSCSGNCACSSSLSGTCTLKFVPFFIKFANPTYKHIQYYKFKMQINIDLHIIINLNIIVRRVCSCFSRGMGDGGRSPNKQFNKQTNIHLSSLNNKV